MKKLNFITAIIAAAILCFSGCGSESSSTQFPDMSKTQEIHIAGADSPGSAKKLNTAEEISSFIKNLDLDHWEPAQPLPDQEPSGTITFAQEKTQKFMQNGSDRQLSSICTIKTYKNAPYVTLVYNDIECSFKVPESTQQYIVHFFE